MSSLKWSLLALTALLSSQFCSANRVGIFSEPARPDPAAWSDLAPPRPPIDLDGAPGPYPAQGPSPASGPGLSPAQGPGQAAGPTPPLTDVSEPSPASKVPPPPKAEITTAEIPAMKNGANESDVSMNCGGGCGPGGGWGGPGCGGPGVGCGGPPCVPPPPPKNPYYCQPARCVAYPGCGAGAGGGGFTIYMDDQFVGAVSSSGNEQKP